MDDRVHPFKIFPRMRQIFIYIYAVPIKSRGESSKFEEYSPSHFFPSFCRELIFFSWRDRRSFFKLWDIFFSNLFALRFGKNSCRKGISIYVISMENFGHDALKFTIECEKFRDSE